MSRIKLLIVLFGLLVWTNPALADGVLAPAANESSLTVTEVDGSPTVTVNRLKVTNGALTDNGDGTATLAIGGSGTGDVVGPASSTDNAIVRFDLATGKLVQNSGVLISDTGDITGANSIAFGADPGDAGRVRLSNNEQICWEPATPGTDLCITLNASNEFVMNAPLNLTGTAGPMLLTGVVSPSAPATAEQWYFYADSVDDLPKYIYNGGSEQTFFTTANPPSISTGVSGLGTWVATFLATPSSANLAAAVTDETGTGAVVLGTAPTISSAVLSTKVNLPRVTAFPGTPSAGDTVIVTDDSTAGACDSAAGSVTSLCQYDGASWVKLGDGTAAGGALSSADIDTSVELRTIVTDESGTGALLFAGGDIAAGTATTPAANDNDTSIATTAYVQTELTAYASDTVTFTNKTLDCGGTGNTCTIKQERYTEVAGCNNTTAGPVYNLPTANAAVPACDTGTNQFSAYLGFNDTTDQSTHGSFRLPTGYSGGIDWMFRYKMASATTGAVGWCVQLVRLATGAAGDPAFPAQAAGNCVSQTVPGTAGYESEATITNVTCTSCVAGDRVFWRVARDADGGAVTDSATGDARLIFSGPSYAVGY